jgi:uncharacterized protein YjiS (DUF1127 family)
MIMSTISSIASQRTIASVIADTLWSAVSRWWVSYMTWRVEQLAISRLQEMSDRQLKDIGIARSQIEAAVTGEIARDRMLWRCS